MKARVLFTGSLLALGGLCAGPILPTTRAADSHWPQWRGPLATGAAPQASPPLEWNETKNVKWKAAIPGEGSSTPAIWGDRVFVLAASSPDKKSAPPPAAPEQRPDGPPPGERPGGPRRGGSGGPGGFGGGEKPTEKYQYTLLCLDRNSGRTRWRKIAREQVPHEGRHRFNTFASGSPVTDGQVVIAYFGSAGLFCYDLDGNLKWEKQLGQMRTRNGFGEGSSPALHGDTVVVNWDDETDNDFIAAFDKHTGRELWRTARSEPTTWSTPLILEQGARQEVIVNATGKVRSYDLGSGAELWSCAGQTANVIPSPVADADTVYLTSGFRGAALFAIRRGASGDVTGKDAIRWQLDRDTPYVPSPLLVDGLLYFAKGNSGTLSCYDAKTGQPHFAAERLAGVNEIYASPVASPERVYVLSRDGVCVVLKKGPKLEVLATNKLDDATDASMALAGKDLFIRGSRNLYCLAE